MPKPKKIKNTTPFYTGSMASNLRLASTTHAANRGSITVMGWTLITLAFLLTLLLLQQFELGFAPIFKDIVYLKLSAAIIQAKL